MITKNNIKNICTMIVLIFIVFILLDICSYFVIGLGKYNRINQRANLDVYKNESWAKSYWREMDKANIFRYESWIGLRGVEFNGKYVNVGKDGNRVTYSCNQEKKLKIFMFGGSTMWGEGSIDNETIPSYISSILCKNNFSADVTNFGERGFQNIEGLIQLEMELREGNVPDMVIFYDGFNNVYSSYQNGKIGVAQNYEWRVLDFSARKELRINLITESFLSTAIKEVMSRLGLIQVRENKVSEELEKQTFESYIENVRIIKALGKEYKFQTYFFWQPILSIKKTSTEEEKILLNQQPNEVTLLYNSITSKIKGTGVMDLSAIFDNYNKTLYWDPWHPSKEGNSIVAERIAVDIENYLNSHKLA